MSPQMRKIKTARLTWLDFEEFGIAEADYLRETYDFHPLDIEDCLSPSQRPKLDEYPNYIFMILTFPIYNREERSINSAEINFFIGPEYLITVNKRGLPPISKLFEQCQLNDTSREKFMDGNPTKLLYEILNRLQEYCFPMLDHISDDIDGLEKGIFRGRERQVVRHILSIRRNIVNFRKIMQAHRNVIRKLMTKNTKYFIPTSIDVYYANILEQTKDIWDILNNQKETIEALHSTNESLIYFQLNDIMRLLTIISVLIVPANLVASLFGMNTPLMPLVRHPYGFWMILGLMVIMILTLLIVFRKKRWL
ncbi:MAG: magnesium/cobalt transporter CorA [Candidatus Komeilibacteria bacterium]|nr:magnesium/cobalt transporter CorA [Candidatus Komeilibacteria bacterium]